jgi:Tol biopolymer transport system component
MPLEPGDKLGPYEIVSRIGAGGMGEVWQARDRRLDRTVAVKVLPERIAKREDLRARFEREARAVASLNHPNICTLFDIGTQAGVGSYMVMECLEGETLAARIGKGAIPLDQAISFATQIADALTRAHRAGVTHRDVKPQNIMLTRDGVKVLDFGLAKSAPKPGPGEETLTAELTIEGTVMGTPQYMAPEQFEGKEADARCDIWAFGTVLYEMVTGQKAFQGKDCSSLVGAILASQPAPMSVKPFTPAWLERLVRRCLAKDPEYRWQSMRDVVIELQMPPQESATVGPSKAARWPWAVAALAGALALALAFVHFSERLPVTELSRFQIPMPANVNFPGTYAPQEVSPDGRKLAFVAAGADGKVHLWIRSLDSLAARILPGADILYGPTPLFWSSDSRSIAFWSAELKLRKVDLSGGPAQTICDARDVHGGSWSPDGVILFGVYPGVVMRVSAAGGTPTALTALDPARQETAHVFPKLLPDGRHFLYFRYSPTPGNSGIYVGSIDAKPSEQSTKPLLANEAYPEYYVPSGNSSTGQLLLYRDGTVLAQPINLNKAELIGDPIPVAEQVGGYSVFEGFFSASTNGVLTYVGGNGGVGDTQLTWFDRQGKNLGTLGEPGNFSTVALSKDGKQGTASRQDSQSASKVNLWRYDFAHGGAGTRFTFDASMDSYPVFSPDSSRVAFQSVRDGIRNLYQKLTSGIRDEELLLKSDEAKYPSGWSPDGRFLLYTVESPKTKYDVWILPIEGNQKQPILFQGTEFNETAAQFSPDGRWIAYVSDESGRYEVYVREFSLGSDGKPEATVRHQISTGGGSYPNWRDDGKELIYVSLDRSTIMSAEIATKPALQVSPPKPLFQFPTALSNPPAVTGDGKRFLVAVPVAQSAQTQFTVVLNWTSLLKK